MLSYLMSLLPSSKETEMKDEIPVILPQHIYLMSLLLSSKGIEMKDEIRVILPQHIYLMSLLFSSKGMEIKDEIRVILPQEIITEILKRLPVKSLIRFQSVCKLWYNLIKSPSFISAHLHLSAHNNPFLIFGETRFGNERSRLRLLLDSKMKIVEILMPLVTVPFSHYTNFIRLLGSCNGLFLVEKYYESGDDYSVGDVYFHSLFLCNPMTRELKEVPESQYHRSDVPEYGFAFSPILSDYKIVRFNKKRFSKENFVEVYSLRRGSWREVESVVLNRVSRLRYRQPIISDGTMFWLGVEKGHDHHMVISFDIATEVFSLMPLPSSITPHSDSNVKLSVYDNKLAMFWGPYKIGDTDYSSFFDLWVMEERESWSWTKKFSIGPISNWLYPLCIWRNKIVCTNCRTRPRPRPRPEISESNRTHFFLSLFNLTTNEWTSHNFLDLVSYDDDIFSFAESLICLQHLP